MIKKVRNLHKKNKTNNTATQKHEMRRRKSKLGNRGNITRLDIYRPKRRNRGRQRAGGVEFITRKVDGEEDDGG